MLRYKVIVNPQAAAGRAGRIVPALEKAFRQHHAIPEIFLTHSKEEATSLARDNEGYASVVAVGGDGTINSVVNGLAGQQTPLGIIPAGSVNRIAKSLGIPSGLSASTDLLLSQDHHPVDLGEVNGAYFLGWLSAGFDAETVRTIEQHPRLKQITFGRKSLNIPLYLAIGFSSLLRSDFAPKVTTPEAEISGSLVQVSNFAHYPGGWKLFPRASPQDGKLDVLIHLDGRLPALTKTLISSFHGNHLTLRSVRYLQQEELRIDGHQIPLQADGEFIGYTPVTVRTHANKIRVLAMLRKCSQRL
ncbi:MAG: diacylglycerol kinase family protein [Nanoarchaeota archaeon]